MFCWSRLPETGTLNSPFASLGDSDLDDDEVIQKPRLK